jgi:hypothetical protein
VNVVLLSIRFFWVPRNLRRTIYLSALNNKTQPKLSKLTGLYFASNWLIIFFHGGLFFTLCTEYKFIMFSLASNAEPTPSIFEGYFFAHIFLLTVNGAWIATLAWREEKLAKSAGLSLETQGHAGLIWARNNLVCSLLAIAPLALIGTCFSAHFACIVHLGIENNGLESAIVTSSVMVSSLFNVISYLFPWFGVEAAYDITLWVLAWLLINSLIDLLTTSGNYIILEEVEWEGQQRSTTEPASPPQPVVAGDVA